MPNSWPASRPVPLLGRRELLIAAGVFAATPRVQAQIAGRQRQIAILMSYPDGDPEASIQVQEFTRALAALGWVDGQSAKLRVDWRAPAPHGLQGPAKDLIALNPDVVLAGATPAALALKAATSTVPIVFANVADPLGQGFVSNLTRPDGNMTGFGAFEFSISGKWIQGLKEVAPSIRNVVVIYNAETAPFYQRFLPAIHDAARSVMVDVKLIEIAASEKIVPTLEAIASEMNSALVVLPGARFTSAKDMIVDAVARLRLPAVYPYTYWVTSGGLLSYGFDAQDMFRRAGSYVDRLLRGAKVAELPVQHPTKFELAINIKQAKALGLNVPTALMATADHLIE